MSETAERPDGWEQHRLDQLQREADATPLQRLQWLEEAIAFAFRTGALPRPTESQPRVS